ncbi:hypothetical protein Tco_0832229 [Tanacetum coccineum]
MATNEETNAAGTDTRPPMKKLDSEFNDEENNLEMADPQSRNHSHQGLPRASRAERERTYSNRQHAKEIWDNCGDAYSRIQVDSSQEKFPPTYNQLRTILSISLPTPKLMLRCMMVRLLLNRFRGRLQCKEPQEKMDSQYFKDKALLIEVKMRKRCIRFRSRSIPLQMWNASAPYDQPQALTTTTCFQANHDAAL